MQPATYKVPVGQRCMCCGLRVYPSNYFKSIKERNYMFTLPTQSKDNGNANIEVGTKKKGASAEGKKKMKK